MRFSHAFCLCALLAGFLLPMGCDPFNGMDSGDSEPAAQAPAPRTKQPAERPAPRRTAPAKPRLEMQGDRQVMRVMLPASSRGTVLLEKSAPKNVLVGKPFDYSLKVTNETDSDLQDVTLVGKLPENFQVISSTPTASITGRDATWTLPTLKAGQSKIYVVRGKATTTGTLTGCSDMTFRLASACLTIHAVEPALKIAKTGPKAVLICEPIEYQVVVTNPGSGPATNVKFEDKLPDGLVYQDKFQAVSAEIGTLAPGASKKLTYRVRATKTGTFTNTAHATADGDLTAKDSARTLVRQPVLKVAKKAPKLRYVGTSVTYTLTVSNTGDGEARNTVLTDTLPNSASFVSASAGGKRSGNKVTWNLGTLAVGDSKEVKLSLKADTIGTLENYATATAVCAKASAKARTQVRGIPAILLECVDLTDPLAVGETETYVITVTNQGSAVGTGIVIVCELPDQQTFLSVTGPTKHTVEGGKKITFAPLAQLAPKAKTTYRVNVKGDAVGDVRFKVSLTSDQMETPAFETESTHIYLAD
jgi:uncharacterized repeat protein (TIGR01451 family)